MKQRVVIVDDDLTILENYCRLLTREGFDPIPCSSMESFLEILESSPFDVVVTDLYLSAKVTGFDILRESHRCHPQLPVIIITGSPDLNSSMSAVRHDAFDYLVKPVTPRILTRSVQRAAEFSRKLLADKRDQLILNSVFQQSGDAILAISLNGQVVDANPSAVEMFQTPIEELRSRSLVELDPALHSRLQDVITEITTTGQSISDLQIRMNRMQEEAQYTVSCSPLKRNEGEVKGIVIRLQTRSRFSKQNLPSSTRTTWNRWSRLIGSDPLMVEVLTKLKTLAATDVSVLLLGESGTGKELVAHALHEQGHRAKGPYVCVDCSTLNESLLESELFGHIKGAFTGASRDRKGWFARADGGTLFLDEIGDISLSIQKKIMRFLQEREFSRVGDSRPIQVDVRILTATNKDLKSMVASGTFREDLYYRLKIMEVYIPPLRERPGDIPVLVEHFVDEFNSTYKSHVRQLNEDAWTSLHRYHWPGNVRELRHVIEHAVVLCQDETITLEHLPRELQNLQSLNKIHPIPHDDNSTLNRDQILAALQRVNWKRQDAADLLSISRQTLYRKMKEFNIRKENQILR